MINKEKDNVTLKKSKKNYEKLVEEVSTVEVISINESKYSDEDKILLSLISLIDKLDCAGEVIFSIDKMNQLENRVFLNVMSLFKIELLFKSICMGKSKI